MALSGRAGNHQIPQHAFRPIWQLEAAPTAGMAARRLHGTPALIEFLGGESTQMRFGSVGHDPGLTLFALGYSVVSIPHARLAAELLELTRRFRAASALAPSQSHQRATEVGGSGSFRRGMPSAERARNVPHGAVRKSSLCDASIGSNRY